MRFERIALATGNLTSRTIRRSVGERGIGERAPNLLQQVGGLIAKAFRAGKGLVNSIINKIKTFEWNFSDLGNALAEGLYELLYFDWNISDKEIEEEIKQNNITIARMFGNLAGQGLVWFASAGVAKLLAFKFPVLAGKVGLELAKEGTQTMKAQMISTLKTTGEIMAKSQLLKKYGWLRKRIKGGKETKGGKPWILAEKIEEKVEQIKSPELRAFVSGAVDGAIDALVDVIYVVAFTLDDHYQSQREALQDAGEPIRTVQVYPNADSEEFVVIEDTQENVEAQITNYLGVHSLVENRDVGTVVGQPYDDWYTLTPQGRKLLLEFNGKEKPPFRDTDGKETRRVQVSIPDAKAGIGWNDLKTIRPFTWGNYMARGVFENRRQMTVWGASESEAKNTLLELARLSTKQLIQVSVSHPEIQNPARKKKATRVYPVHATMLVRKSTQTANSTPLIDGQNREMARTRVQIWKDDPPPGFAGFQ